MVIGGVLLASGMLLEIKDKDYLYGQGDVLLTVRNIIEVRRDAGNEWVVLDGQEYVRRQGFWRYRRLQIKVSALRRCATLTSA